LAQEVRWPDAVRDDRIISLPQEIGVNAYFQIRNYLRENPDAIQLQDAELQTIQSAINGFSISLPIHVVSSQTMRRNDPMKNTGILLIMAVLLVVMGIAIPVLALAGIGLLIAKNWLMGALCLGSALGLFWLFEWLRELRRRNRDG